MHLIKTIEIVDPEILFGTLDMEFNYSFGSWERGREEDRTGGISSCDKDVEDGD